MSVLSNYTSLCERRGHPVNQALANTFEHTDPSVFCFRGNDTPNFNLRVTDEDLSIIC